MKYIWLVILILLSISNVSSSAEVVDDYYVIFSDSVDIYPLENDTGVSNIPMIGTNRIIKGDIDIYFYRDDGPDYYTFTPYPGQWGADQHWMNIIDNEGNLLNSWVFIWVDVYPGDLNHDGIVEDDDLSILLSNWKQYRTYQKGNIWLGTHEDPVTDDLVGIVDEDDLSMLLSFWKYESPGFVSVPEPSMFLLLLTGSIMLLKKR